MPISKLCLNFSVLLTVWLLILISCKEEEIIEAPKTQTDILIGLWEVTSMKINGDPPSNDFYKSFNFINSEDLEECFQENGGQKTCDLHKWFWKNDEEEIITIYLSYGKKTEWHIIALNQSELKVTSPFINNPDWILEYAMIKVE